jgi:hypothetical protein
MPAITSKTVRSNDFPFELVRPHLELVEVAIREQVRAFRFLRMQYFRQAHSASSSGAHRWSAG